MPTPSRQADLRRQRAYRRSAPGKIILLLRRIGGITRHRVSFISRQPLPARTHRLLLTGDTVGWSLRGKPDEPAADGTEPPAGAGSGRLLPFTTAIAATHLFASFLAFDDHAAGPGLAERVAVVLFDLNLTLAALMVYLVIRHAARTPGVAADDMAGQELQVFASERRGRCCSRPGPHSWGPSCR
jgi:hypothetical protein